jgi:hypothetical protein
MWGLDRSFPEKIKKGSQAKKNPRKRAVCMGFCDTGTEKR